MIRRLNRRRALELIAASAGALLVGPSHAFGAERGAAQRSLSALQNAVRGKVVVRGAAGYDSTRRSMVWNPRVADLRVPDAIVQVTSAQDAAAAIKFARAHGLKVSVRSGGHNYQGAVLRNGGLLLDLSGLKYVSVDVGRRRANIGPGVKSGELASALAGHGLAFPVGHCSDVALGGYLLNGGWGWNAGEWGPACMSVTGVEMLTAGGELVYADEKSNSELFWAARGAGPGFFAVVTRFNLALKPVRTGIQTFAVSFPLAATSIIGEWLRQVLPSIHRTIEVACTLGPIEPKGPPLVVVSVVSFAATAAEAHARLAPLRKLPAGATPLGPVIDQPANFSEIQQQNDLANPSGKRMGGDQLYSDASPERLLQAVQHLATDMPSAPSAITIGSLGGSAPAPSMPSPQEAALLSESGVTSIGAYAFWDDPAEDARNLNWVNSVLGASEKFRKGRYVGEADLAVTANRVRECFSPEAWTRLVTLREKYDPTGLLYSYLTN
jgi:FAD/FMN-containing dehydrogenase